MSEAPRPHRDVATLEREVAERDALIAALQLQNATLEGQVATLDGQIAALQSALVNHATEIELLKRRLFGPRSERGGTSETLQPGRRSVADEVAVVREGSAERGHGCVVVGTSELQRGLTTHAKVVRLEPLDEKGGAVISTHEAHWDQGQKGDDAHEERGGPRTRRHRKLKLSRNPRVRVAVP